MNSCSILVPNVDLFIQMHIIKEANTSSRIEGTQTDIDEAVRPAEMIAAERRDDWQEVQNYVEAMNFALGKLDALPLSNRSAMLATARSGRDTFEKVVDLRSDAEAKTLSLGGRAENARKLLDHLYQSPFVTANSVADLLGVTHQTASKLIADFVKLDFLSVSTKLGKSQGYEFERYLDLFDTSK